MVNVASAVNNVYKIINDYMTKLLIKGTQEHMAVQYALSLLCMAKGQCDDISQEIDNLDSRIDIEHGFNTNSISEIVTAIRTLCEDKIDEILPACADYVIEKTVVNRYGEFIQPRELTELVLSLVKERGCKIIYNPFAGNASYAMGDFIKKYYGQEYDPIVYDLAKMRLYLHNIDFSNYKQENSIDNWDDHGVDCIASTPPFGEILNAVQKRHFNASTIEEFLLSRFISGNAKCGFFVVSRGTCFKNNGTALRLRKEICEKNMLDMVINLPSGIFSFSGISTSIIVLNKLRTENEAITFVDAEKLYSIRGKREKVLNVDGILHAIKSMNSDVTYRVNNQNLYNNDFSFDVMRYATQVLTASEGQVIIPIKDVLSLDKGQKCEFHNEKIDRVLESSHFVTNVVDFKDVEHDAWVNQPKIKFEGPHIAINLQGKIYVHKGNSHFYIGTALSNSVFKVNEDIVDIEYLAYKLLDSGLLDKVVGGAYIARVNTNLLLSYKLVIDGDKEKQRKTIAKIKRSFIDSERKRLGIREAGGDLSHMLGMPKDTIGNYLDMLLMSDTLSEPDRESIKAINDNFRYMLRLINMVGADFSSISMSDSPSHIGIAKFIKDYAASLKHLKFSKCFQLIEDTSLSDNIIVNCDEDMLRVVLDTAFRNAYSHGFEQKYSESNFVKFGCKIVEYDGHPFVCITIANNGNPMPTDFSLEDFATRGMKAGKMGNTGKGGYHIYSIAKRYGGYINISSSKEWPFILDVLIPALNIDTNNTTEDYGSKCL